MTRTTYDAIIVGARCAGAPTAMLLARSGARVLLVDRAHFPSDTISGHVIQPAGVGLLDRWGLLDTVLASGCPPLTGVSVAINGRVLPPPPAPPNGMPFLAPRRTVLDLQLVEAAARAGVDVCEATSVSGLLRDEDRVVGIQAWSETRGFLQANAPIVIGADGKQSYVAHEVDASFLDYRETVSIAYYAYWSRAAADAHGIQLYFAGGRFAGLVPTHDDLVLAFVQCRRAERQLFRADAVSGYLAALISFPEIAETLDGAILEGPLRGMLDQPTFFRQSFGNGWALAGDAAHHKDPLIARGITDAFRDAELLSRAVTDGLSGKADLMQALAQCQELREATSCEVSALNHDLADLPEDPQQIEARLGALLAAQMRADAALESVIGMRPLATARISHQAAAFQ